jgi:hypothetical protein
MDVFCSFCKGRADAQGGCRPLPPARFSKAANFHTKAASSKFLDMGNARYCGDAATAAHIGLELV